MSLGQGWDKEELNDFINTFTGKNNMEYDMPESMCGCVTTDREDPRLVRSNDEVPREQAEVYLVLSEEERSKGFVRPFRRSYKHLTCSKITTMGAAIAETYARDPSFYTGTYCAYCMKHRPLWEFEWMDGTKLGE